MLHYERHKRHLCCIVFVVMVRKRKSHASRIENLVKARKLRAEPAVVVELASSSAASEQNEERYVPPPEALTRKIYECFKQNPPRSRGRKVLIEVTIKAPCRDTAFYNVEKGDRMVSTYYFACNNYIVVRNAHLNSVEFWQC